MSLFTVLGATGFIGRHLAEYLRGQGHSVYLPERDCPHLRGKPLGHVIYCIGTTGNFRQNPHAAVDAHVNKLYSLMEGAEFDSWLYLSSTRIYERMPKEQEAREDMDISVFPSSHSIFDLTKLLGESVCIEAAGNKAKIVRLSNVYGYDQSSRTFLGAVLNDLCVGRPVEFQDSPESEKDYISIEDVTSFLMKIALSTEAGIFNLAKGQNLTNHQIANALRSIGCSITFKEGGGTRVFPRISSEKISLRFGAPTRCLLNDIATLLKGRRDFIAGNKK